MDATLKEHSHNYNNKSIDIVLELVQEFQKNISWYVNHLRSHSEVLKVVKSVPWTMMTMNVFVNPYNFNLQTDSLNVTVL